MNQGWKEVLLGTAPEKTISAGYRIQTQRRQYGLKHRVFSTVHASMGNTENKVATEISDTISTFKLWDKSQVIVVISRTKVGKNTRSAKSAIGITQLRECGIIISRRWPPTQHNRHLPL